MKVFVKFLIHYFVNEKLNGVYPQYYTVSVLLDILRA